MALGFNFGLPSFGWRAGGGGGGATDPYWPYVSMLLHGDSAQQFNQDTSTNVFPISDSAVPIYSVASMQASTRTPFTGGPSSNGSGFFNGTTAGLSVPANAAFALGATATIEMWLYVTSSTAQRIIGNYQAGAGFDVLLISGLVYVSGAAANATASFPLNTWTHLAVVYTSGTLTIYYNGVAQTLAGTTTGYSFIATGPVYIGNNVGSSQFFSGFMSNVRVVKGVAVYTGNFTPPTASLAATQSSGTNISAITGTQTSLLTLQTNVPQNNNQFFDTSTNNFTVTRNGNTTQGSFNPFVSTYPYAVATNGGSAYFDGTGDYLTVPDSTAFTLGANDFTIECWVNASNTSSPMIAAQTDSALSVLSFYIIISSGAFQCVLQDASSAYKVISGTGGSIVANTWCHVAFVRNGNTARAYVNGVQKGTVDVTGFTVRNSADVFGVGGGGAYTGNPYAGYISNFRLVNGTCLYPSGTTFTPPTAPLTAVTNTALLLGMSNGAIYDNTMLNNLETVANAQISTSVFKYGTGSMKFNGTTDYLPTPAKTAFALGSGDFTIEMWVYQTASQNAYIAGQIDAAVTAASSAWYMYITSGGIPLFGAYSSTTQLLAISGIGVSTNAWTHIAAVRDGTNLRIYVNGVQGVAPTAISTVSINTSSNSLAVGRAGEYVTSPFNGYIDDFRFTKGICRYPSGTTFTPPTAAFPNQGTTTYPVGWLTQQAIFGFGVSSSSIVSVTNKVSSVGVVSADTTGVGTARYVLAAASYGGDKAIFGYGNDGFNPQSMTNKVSNTGVVATDTTGVGTARTSLAAASYGGDKAIFGFGGNSNITNLVSNVGVVATDTTGVGTVRDVLAGVSYGGDKAIFGYGASASTYSLTNLVSNTGVVASDTTGVGTARYQLAAATYGYTGQAMFGYGYNGSSELSMTNLVANTGVVATDTTGVGTARRRLAAASYGGGNAIFGYGSSAVSSYTSITNLVSAIGIVANDVSSAGTARYGPAAAGYSA